MGIVCLGWRMQTNPPQIYINKLRIHHYQLGISLLLLGIITKKPFLSGGGSMLILDHIDDFIQDYNYKILNMFTSCTVIAF